MTAALFIGLLMLSSQSNCWQSGYDMGRGIINFCWTCLETCLELPKSRYLVSLYSDLMDQFEGSMITSGNSCVARESSRVIILIYTTGHSACTSKVCDIFDRQTHIPNGRWQLMCLRVLQPWDRRNSMTAPVRNITLTGTTPPGQCGPGSNKRALQLLQDWSFTIRCFSVISKTLIREGVIPLCRDAVSVFYSPSQMGCQRWNLTDIITRGLSWPGSNGSEEVLYTPKSSRIIISPSDAV